jgi:F0F1-type ATP synthase assembly protein I
MGEAKKYLVTAVVAIVAVAIAKKIPFLATYL